MGSVNSIPVVAQVKIAAQLISGDIAGAEQTNRDFNQQCPGISQVHIN